MGVKVTNNGFGTISAGITSSATTVVLDSGQGARFPTLASGDFFFGTLVDTSNNIEIIKVTARSSDSMTVVRGQDNTSARAFSVGDRFELRPTAALFENAHLDNTPTSTGSLGLPKGTTAQQPTASATEGHIRYDTDDDIVYYSDGVSWKRINSSPVVFNSITGSVLTGQATTLTLAGSGFGGAITVNFEQTSDSIDTDVSVTPASDTSASVAVPSAVYNNVTATNVITVKITNSDGNSSTRTIAATGLPSGGTVSTSGNYRFHTFNTSGTLTVPAGFSQTVDYLLVAGGGGGSGGSGGGAGGMLTGTTSLSASTNYSIVIGAGGTGIPDNTTSGTIGGSNSTAFSLTAIGGGGGATNNQNAGNGGSGGGGWHQRPTGGSGTSGQGNNGGNGSTSGAVAGGGGGGKGAVGGNGSSGSAGGSGGVGGQWSVNSSYYAGGGGGAGYTFATNVAGGNGGGGASGTQYGSDGTANTGGGGGGVHYGIATSAVRGGNGGSGICIVRVDTSGL